MLLNEQGNPIEQPQPKNQPHQFGQFVIPADACIKGMGGMIEGNESNPYIPSMYGWPKKQHTRKTL